MPQPKNLHNKYEQLHVQTIVNSMRRIQKIYEQAVQEISLSVAGVIPQPKPFDLRDYPLIKNRVEQIVASMHRSITVGVANSIELAWGNSNDKNDEIVDQRLADSSSPIARIYYDPNRQALDAFKSRKERGLDLSERVWNLLEPFKHELEQGIGLGIGSGANASRLASDFKQYLQNPDKLFRRVRGEDGKLRLSKRARNYHPGRGVYRSSYKNAMRLTRTETNMAYRTADFERWKKIDFVLGYQVRLSLSHPKFDICDHLIGKYPKEFKFVGWHPHCLCNAIPILATDAEYDKYEDAILRGEEDQIEFKQVDDTPQGFKDYIRDHKEKLNLTVKKPYWYRDNVQFVEELGSPVQILMRQAKDAGPDVQEVALGIATRHGAGITDINYKSRGSIMRKVRDEYGGDYSKVKDAARTTIVAPGDQINAILKEFEDLGMPIKRQKTSLGYTGNIVTYKSKSGLLTEIQVNTPEMIYAKELEEDARRVLGDTLYDKLSIEIGLKGGQGHAYYEKYRVLDPLTRATTRLDLEVKSTDYYNSIRAGVSQELKKSLKVDLKLAGLVKAEPRLPGETDKAYAKRVIDKLPEPTALYDKPELYFNIEKGIMVNLDKLKPIKAAEETVQSGANAINRMWAASQGILSRRDPISVGAISPGKYIVLDGNSTYTGAKNSGWSRLSVKVLTTAEIKELAKDDPKIKELFFPEKKPKAKKSTEIKLSGTKFTQDALDKVLKAKSQGFTTSSINAIDVDPVVKQSLKNWFGTSNSIRRLSDLFPEKRWWLKAVTSETTRNELYRGERFTERQTGDEFVRQKDVFDYLRYVKYKKGAIVDFSQPDKIMVQNQMEKKAVEVILDNRLLSYTFSKSTANGFANTSSPNAYSVLTTVRGKNGKPVRGFDVSQIGYLGEDEVVVGDSYKYEVVKVLFDKKLNVLYVTLEQIAD